MTLNLNHYRLVMPTIIAMTKELKTSKERYALLSRLTLACSCHIVAVVYYLAELYGMDEHLQGWLDRNEKPFYRIEEVTNYKEKRYD